MKIFESEGKMVYQCERGTRHDKPRGGGGGGGGTLNVKVIGMLVENFYLENPKNTQILILDP